MKRDIIILGPKKTATTSLYDAVANTELKRYLIGKESNQFIEQSAFEIFARNSTFFIDISPEYYTSFRAILKIHEFSRLRGSTPLLITLERNSDARRKSHYSYMHNKRLVDSAMNGNEIEAMCLTELKIWDRCSTIPVCNVDLAGAIALLEAEGNINIAPKVSNVGGQITVNSGLIRVLQFANKFLIKLFPSARWRVSLAKQVGRITYRAGGAQGATVPLPDALSEMLSRLGDEE